MKNLENSWKGMKNMNADMKWLDNPEVFRVNQLEAHSDHCYYLDYSDMKKEKNPLFQSLNGQWEFSYSKNVKSRPVNFYEETFDASGFDKIMVPGHIELAGYDKIRYINTMYPWEGKEYHRGAYSMEVTGAEKGMFSEAEYNPVGSYIKYFDLDKSTASSTAENGSGEVEKIIVSFPTWTGAPADTEKVQEAINDITRDKIGVEIELSITDYGSFNQNTTLALSANEEIDVLACVGFPYATGIQQGYLSDLEENDLIQTYGQGIIDAVGQENVDACRVNGVLYGLPSNRDIAQGRGCAAIATEYLDGIGYEANTDDEIVKISLDELNDIYAQLHEKYPDKEVYRPTTGSMSQFSNVDSLGGNVFGVLLDYGQNLDVVNLFESDFYKDYCARLYDYNQKGYISADASTDTTAVGELVKAGTLMSYTTGGKPGIKAQETTLTGRDMTIFQTLDDYISSTSVASMPWTIPISAQHKEAAMKFLNECYTNADIANLLAWGIEGTHYKIGDDGLATYADGVDASNSGWNHSMGWMMPNQFLTHVWEGNDPDLWTEMKEFNTNAKVSKASGFSFDSTNVANELTAVQNVYNEYQTSVEYGFVDPETGIAEMNDKMMTAGLQKIIDEKKAQLAAWQEANK